MLQVKVRVDDVRKVLLVLDKLADGRDVINLMNRDFPLGQFKGRLDMDRTAIMGHSFGGGTSVLALAEERRFK